MREAKKAARKQEFFQCLKTANGNINQAAQLAGIGRAAVYRYMEEDTAFRDKVETFVNECKANTTPKPPKQKIETEKKDKKPRPIKVGVSHVTKVPVKTKVRVKGTREKEIVSRSTKRVVFEIPNWVHDIIKNGRDPEAEMTREQKITMGDLVCRLYEEGATLEESCRKANLSTRTFNRWVNPSKPQYLPEVAEYYKEAKENYLKNRWDRIEMKAFAGLEKLLTEREVEESKVVGTVSKNAVTGEEVVTPTQITKVKKKKEEHANAVLYVLRNRVKNPEDDKEKEVGSQSELRLRPIEDIMAEKEEIKRKLGLL